METATYCARAYADLEQRTSQSSDEESIEHERVLPRFVSGFSSDKPLSDLV